MIHISSKILTNGKPLKRPGADRYSPHILTSFRHSEILWLHRDRNFTPIPPLFSNKIVIMIGTMKSYRMLMMTMTKMTMPMTKMTMTKRTMTKRTMTKMTMTKMTITKRLQVHGPRLHKPDLSKLQEQLTCLHVYMKSNIKVGSVTIVAIMAAIIIKMIMITTMIMMIRGVPAAKVARRRRPWCGCITGKDDPPEVIFFNY